MILLIGISEAEKKIASFMQQRRVALGLTQAGLAKNAGVSLSTLRKFEQKGAISLESLLKIASVLGVLDKLVTALQPEHQPFLSIDDVIAAQNKPVRKRGRRQCK